MTYSLSARKAIKTRVKWGIDSAKVRENFDEDLTMPLMPSEIRVPAEARTLAGFRAWCQADAFPESGKIAYLGGELFIDFTPEGLNSHNKVKTEVIRVVANFVLEADLGKAYSAGARIVNPDAELSNQPDGAFCSWGSFESKTVRAVRGKSNEDDVELEGSPDWVMEIISPSSEHKDLKDLWKRYHKAGIREYWLIDARGDKIRFRILVHHAKGYVEQPSEGGWFKSKVFARAFRLKKFKDRLGTWSYRLEIRE
jgi:Uma2 family endonuclease